MGLFSNLRGATAAPTISTAHETARVVLTRFWSPRPPIARGEIDQILNMCAFNPIFQSIGSTAP